MELSDSQGVRAQFALWGYVITGDILERAAVIAEAKNVDAIYPAAWDTPGSRLAGSFIAKGGEYRRVKDWSALPWVGEHMLRGHEAWAGL